MKEIDEKDLEHTAVGFYSYTINEKIPEKSLGDIYL